MSHLRIRLHEDILWLILDRPPLNVLNIEMLDQLTTAMRRAIKNSPRLIVITGAGERAFCAGVDIHDHLDGREVEMLRVVRVYGERAHVAAHRACDLPVHGARGSVGRGGEVIGPFVRGRARRA